MSVSGRVIPVAVKPAPEMLAELTVTGAFPVEVSVRVCVASVFTFTLPKFMLLALAVRVAIQALSESAKVLVAPFSLAVRVTVCAEETALAVAVKLALEAPAATVTEAGTVTAELLLARFTARPPLAAAAFSVTVQVSVAGPLIEPLAQVSPVNTGTPVPVRLTAVELPVDELLVMVSVPEAAPAAVGSNCTVSVAD